MGEDDAAGAEGHRAGWGQEGAGEAAVPEPAPSRKRAVPDEEEDLDPEVLQRLKAIRETG